jgi:hypothetical protein
MIFCSSFVPISCGQSLLIRSEGSSAADSVLSEESFLHAPSFKCTDHRSLLKKENEQKQINKFAVSAPRELKIRI